MIKKYFQTPERDRWEDYFDPGEVLLWQGAPEPGPHSYWGPIAISIFGIPFFLAGLSTAATGLGFLFGMRNLGDLGIGLFMTAFSVPFLGVGFAMCFGTWIYARIGHRFTRYALSNRRAYVAHHFFRHSLSSYRIRPDDAITLVQGKFDSIMFKTIHGRDSDGDKTTEKIGFISISDGNSVYDLIRKIQREQT